MYELYEGNCLDILPTLPNDHYQIIFTSPPYNIDLKYIGFKDKLSDEEFKSFNAQWLQEAYRVAAPSSRLYLVVGDDMHYWIRAVAEGAGWRFVQTLTWCKPNMVSAKFGCDWRLLSEFIILFRKGKRNKMQQGFANSHNWFVVPTPQTNFNEDKKLHPAQFPIDLVKMILSRTPGKNVLDPFCGSGAVGEGALLFDRHFTGIELSPVYVEMTRARLERALLQPKLEFSPLTHSEKLDFEEDDNGTHFRDDSD